MTARSGRRGPRADFRSEPRVLIAGGGSGGHVFPALAVVSAIRRLNNRTRFLFVGSKEGIEAVSVPKAGLTFAAIPTGKWRRYLSVQNFFDLFRVSLGLISALRIIRDFKPDVIFAKGGYVAFPVALAGFLKGVPIIVHESDAVEGLANRLIGRVAKKVCFGFQVSPLSPKSVFTGNPVREKMINWAKRYRLLGNKLKKPDFLDQKMPLVLVLGGSQGAHRINLLVEALLPMVAKKAMVVHQTGSREFARYRQLKQRLKPELAKNYFPFEFLEEDGLSELLATSSLIITRSGANSLSEIALFGKPVILIPLSTAASNHQAKNAAYFKRRGGALVFDERKLNHNILARTVLSIIENKKRARGLAEKISRLGEEDAALKIAEIVLKVRK